jgi:AraC-like DNA-binding protein
MVGSLGSNFYLCPMTAGETIKEGLQYTLTTFSIQRASNAFLSKQDNSISLTCQFSALDCGFAFEDTPVSHDIVFTFHNDYLKGFSAQADFAIDHFPDHIQHDICCNTQMILHDIINCKFSGPFRTMFLESKALSLLLCFQKCHEANQADCGSCKFLTKPVEREKIIKAKEIILNNLQSPPTIPKLSLQIGINQCYLKKGFKEIYGMTVYDYVQEQRMLKAQLLLKQNKYSVAQVAAQIGYSSAGNFSNAFKRYAGVFPSELLTS